MARKNPAAVALGKRGGKALLKERGPEYFATLQAKRKTNAGGRPSMYGPLVEYLSSPQRANRVRLPLTRSQIEDLGGESFPRLAWNDPGWWSQSDSRQYRSFLKAGWKAETDSKTLFEDEEVTFVRIKR